MRFVMANREDKMEETITIAKKLYEELIDDSEFLEALRSAGVDNWDGYSFALEALQAQEKE